MEKFMRCTNDDHCSGMEFGERPIDTKKVLYKLGIDGFMYVFIQYAFHIKSKCFLS